MSRKKFNEYLLLPYEVEMQIIDSSLIQEYEKPLLGEAGYDSFASSLDNSDFTFEFDPTVSKADKLDYQVAAASGALTALINELFVGELSLENSHKWGQKQVEKLIFKRAKKDGYKGNDFNKAIKTLEKKHTMASDLLTGKFGGGRQHHLRDFSHHFSLTGLMFSLISQFTNKGYGTDNLGAFVIYDLPNSIRVGGNFAEKIYLGSIKWLLHLLSDVAGHSGTIGKGTGIPGPILSFLKSTSSIPIFRKLQLKYHDENIDFSVYLSKLYNGTHYVLNNDGEKIPFDLRTEMGIAEHIRKSAVPVLANEVIVRSFYTVRRIVELIDENDIEDFESFLKIDTQSYLPISNRRLNRMMTISSGTFVSLTTLSLTAKGMIKRGPSNALPYILVNTNYFGVLRFAVALKADFEYITEDVKEFKDYYFNRQFTIYDNIDLTLMQDLFSLNYEKERILNSIKYHILRYDIISEKDKDKKSLKEIWFENWQPSYFEPKLEENENYILKTSLDLYQAYNKEIVGDQNKWLTLLYLDLKSFNPYHALDEDVKKYKGLKLSSNYLLDVFIPQQKVLTKSKVNRIDKEIKKSLNIIKSKNRKILVGTTSVITIGALTGGLAFALAPKIAIIIAGSSVSGLSGAALTSASLAIVGGGSLATGGLGMAGGTALIVGGGSLLGATLGTASVLATLGSISSEYALLESTKLLTYIKTELVALEHSHIYLSIIYKTLLKQTNTLEIAKEKIVDKKEIKNINESINYIENCGKEVLKLIKNKVETEQILLFHNYSVVDTI